MSKQRASKQRVENTIDFIQSLTLESCENFIKDSENVEHIELSKDETLMSESSTICIREFDKPILDIKNERFVPHIIV